ncbi:MAG: ATP-binding cassette domain-containing protein [Limisphaerales bacterium]|jgi:molybdate transport system ATP-binding protein|nr:ATP-binding cassette domain-containing protein [Verrucomicrobiota bacterium]
MNRNSDFWIEWENVTLRDRRESPVFPGVDWLWRAGEQWAALGGNSSGRRYFAEAFVRSVPPLSGRIHLNLPPVPDCLEIPGLANRRATMLISPEQHRHILNSESSFYQSRWHGSLEEGSLTADAFLSRQRVEEINPFEIGHRGVEPAVFEAKRQEFLGWMHLEPELLERKLLHLSNGEQRKMILVNALLHSPRLLVLDEPFGGLDVQTRAVLRELLKQLMELGMPIFTLLARPDELLEPVTHLLLLDAGRVVAQGPREEMLAHPLAVQLHQKTLAPSKPRPELKLSEPTALTPAEPPLVELEDVSFQVGEKKILDRIHWKIYPGENWLLLGPNGAGKTSLLSLIQGDHPLAYSLSIRVMGELYRSTRSLWQIRQRMGWISPELHLHYPGGWSCRQVVASGFFHSIGLHTLPNATQAAQVEEWLERWRLSSIADLDFEDVSLGEQRMILLARAVVNRPKLLILDEACQGLDAFYRSRVLEAVDEAVVQIKASLIFVTHYAREIPDCINRLLELDKGRILKKK